MRLTLPTTKLGGIWSMRILPVEKRDASYSPAARDRTRVRGGPHLVLEQLSRDEEGGAVAGAQQTTRCTCTARSEEANDGLHPPIQGTNTPDVIHVAWGISPLSRVCFLPSAVWLVHSPHARRVVQRSSSIHTLPTGRCFLLHNSRNLVTQNPSQSGQSNY